MKGLKIFFNGEEIDVSSDFGVSLMVCTKSEKEQSVANLVGIDREKNTYTWLNSLMNTGDVIDMEIAELNRSSVPISVEKFFLKEKNRIRKKAMRCGLKIWRIIMRLKNCSKKKVFCSIKLFVLW